MKISIDELKAREEYAIWRRRNRVRLLDVSKYIGVSIPVLSRWENGINGISDELLEKYNEYRVRFEAGEIHARNQ